jgi:uncharacterized protein YjbI with pentapeptide repeats
MVTKPPNSRKNAKAPGTRTAPDIPADIREAGFPEDVLSDPEISLRECFIENISFQDRSLKPVALESCVLKRVNFARCNLRGLRLKDVRLVECDFANAEALGLKAVRTEFINCRLTGLKAVEADCQDFLISGGDAGFTQFRLGTFKRSEFNTCNFAEADFHGCDLRGAILRSCEFKNADMTGAKLEEADFRGSRVEGLMAFAADLKGAIVDPAQAMIFAELMGLKIR